MIRIRLTKVDPKVREFEDSLADMITKAVKSMVGPGVDMENFEVIVNETLFEGESMKLIMEKWRKLISTEGSAPSDEQISADIGAEGLRFNKASDISHTAKAYINDTDPASCNAGLTEILADLNLKNLIDQASDPCGVMVQLANPGNWEATKAMRAQEPANK